MRYPLATVDKFQGFPLDFLSERDIQASLFAELRQLTPNLRYPYDANGENSRFGFSEPIYQRPFFVHAVTTEYYLYNEKNKARFDVAVLSGKRDNKAAIWRQPCRVGIEIKLWQPGYRDCRFEADVKKLQNYQEYLRDRFKEEERKFTGVAMVFVHPNIEKKLVDNYLDPLEEFASAAYPEDCVALHWVTEKHHRWKQIPPPRIQP